jgi:hypothetical protein
LPVSLKSGAIDPTAGSSPIVLMGFPLRVILAMIFSFLFRTDLCSYVTNDNSKFHLCQT